MIKVYKPSAAGGFSFSLSSGKGEKKEYPVNPARPVKFMGMTAERISLG